MIGTLNELGAAWWSWVGPTLWQVLLLAVVVGLIDLALSRRGWPQVRYALWLLVFVKLFIPPTFSLPSSVFSQILPARAPEAPIVGAGILPAGAVDVSPLVDYAPGPSLMPAVPVEPIGTRALEGPGLSLQAWAMLLCGAVSLLLLGWLVARGRRLRRVASPDGKQALRPPWLGEVLAECAARLRLRRVPRLVVTDRVGSAAVFGVFRPVLLLPAGACSNLSRERMGHVLLHEMAHIKRGDLIVNAAQTLVHILFWFHPAVWLAGKRLRHLRELCCDATVSKLLREETGEYRATLVDAAGSMVFGKTEPGLGLLGLFESPSRLRQRLQYLERPAWKHTRLRVVVSLAAVGIMLACVVPMTRAKPAEEAVEKIREEAKGAEDEMARARGLIEKSAKGDPGAIDSAIGRLVEIGSPAVEPLIEWLKNEDDSMRQVAAIVLGEIGDRRGVEPLIEALGEAQRRATERPEGRTPEDWVIQHVVVALGKIGDGRAVDTLVAVLQDAEGNLGYSATEALGRIGDKKAVESLIAAAMKGKHYGIRGGACMALGKIGDVRAVEPLIVAMNDEDGWVKRRAVDALGEIGGSRAVEALISALRSDDKDFRERPALVLGEIGDGKALEALEEVAENHELRYVRKAAKEALEKIREGKAGESEEEKGVEDVVALEKGEPFVAGELLPWIEVDANKPRPAVRFNGMEITLVGMMRVDGKFYRPDGSAAEADLIPEWGEARLIEWQEDAAKWMKRAEPGWPLPFLSFVFRLVESETGEIWPSVSTERPPAGLSGWITSSDLNEQDRRERLFYLHMNRFSGRWPPVEADLRVRVTYGPHLPEKLEIDPLASSKPYEFLSRKFLATVRNLPAKSPLGEVPRDALPSVELDFTKGKAPNGYVIMIEYKDGRIERPGRWPNIELNPAAWGAFGYPDRPPSLETVERFIYVGRRVQPILWRGISLEPAVMELREKEAAEWETLHAFEYNGLGGKAIGGQTSAITVMRPEAGWIKEGIGFSIAHTVTDRPTRVIAVDKAGDVHEGKEVSKLVVAGLQQLTVGFADLDWPEVKEFQFQAGPYEKEEDEEEEVTVLPEDVLLVTEGVDRSVREMLRQARGKALFLAFWGDEMIDLRFDFVLDGEKFRWDRHVGKWVRDGKDVGVVVDRKTAYDGNAVYEADRVFKDSRWSALVHAADDYAPVLDYRPYGGYYTGIVFSPRGLLIPQELSNVADTFTAAIREMVAGGADVIVIGDPEEDSNVVLDLWYEGAEHRMYVNVEDGFLITKEELVWGGETKVLSLREYGRDEESGAMVLRRYLEPSRNGGLPRLEISIQYESVNQPVDARLFTLEGFDLPADAIVGSLREKEAGAKESAKEAVEKIRKGARESTEKTEEVAEEGREFDEGTLEKIRAGILKYRGSIESMKASYAVTYRGENWGRVEKPDGSWSQRDRREGDYEWAVEGVEKEIVGTGYVAKRFIRWEDTGPEKEGQTLAYNGEVMTAIRSPGGRKKPRGSIREGVDWSRFRWGGEIMPDVTYTILSDPWQHALEKGTLEVTGAELVHGRECCVLEGRVMVVKEMDFGGYPVKIWLDPGRGFATVKQDSYDGKTGEIRTFKSYEVLEMKDVGEGRWMPVHVLFRNGKEIKVSEISVNMDIPDRLFTLRFPWGMEVADDISGLGYRAGTRTLTILWNKVEDLFQ